MTNRWLRDWEKEIFQGYHKMEGLCEWNSPALACADQDKQVYILAPVKAMAATHASLYWSGQ